MTLEQPMFEGEEWGSKSLAGDFILPPFDIFSAQRGDWQSRKRMWLDVLRLSEHDIVGRDHDTKQSGESSPRKAVDFYRRKAEWEEANGREISTGEFAEKYYDEAGTGRGRKLQPTGAIIRQGATDFYKQKTEWEKANGRTISTKEFQEQHYEYARDAGRGQGLVSGEYNKNIWRNPRFYEQKTAWENANGQKIDAREFYEKYYDDSKNGRLRGTTSQFDPVLAEIVLLWYSAPGWRVFDPFGGGVERGLVSAYMERPYIGVELRAEQVEANRASYERLGLETPAQWIEADAQDTAAVMAGYPKADFVLTCPPYWNLEVYSDDPADVSTMDLPNFRMALDTVIAQTLGVLNDDRFAVMVMGDRRDQKTGAWAHLPTLMTESFERHGALLHNDIIMMTSLGSKPQIARYPFERRRTLMPLYEHVLVFIKGSTKAATEALGEVVKTEGSRFIESGGQHKLL